MAPVTDPWILAYFASHVYSTAPEAKSKLAIDLKFIGNDYKRGSEINIGNETYLKALIDTASKGKQKVGAAKGLQFFIIRGGAEGFLPQSMRRLDASQLTVTTTDTRGVTSVNSVVDHNDLLAVFDSTGRLVTSARLERPLVVTDIWSRRTADKVYGSWSNREVIVYRNENFSIPYVGLGVRDGFRNRKRGTGRVVIDMHKQEYTNGCIFIVDRATPVLGDDAALGAFEPQLIKDVLKQVGIDIRKVGRSGQAIGKIYQVTIL